MVRSRMGIIAAALFLWTGGILLSCGGSEQPPPPSEKQVVTGKIPAVAPKTEPVKIAPAATPPPAPTVAQTEPPPAPAVAQPAAKPEPEPVAPADQASIQPAAAGDVSGTAPAPASPQVQPGQVETKAPALAAGQESAVQEKSDPLVVASLKRLLSLETDFSYEPENKIDPFAPVFDTGAPEPPPGAETSEKPEKRVPQSPIEMVDLSQLKLTGIILAPSGNRALVQDATGKGYIIYTGTYIGNREGQVAKILSDRLIVEEKTRDDLGKSVTEARELKLPKPPGEM